MKKVISILFLLSVILNVSFTTEKFPNKNSWRITINDSIVHNTNNDGYGPCKINLNTLKLKNTDTLKIDYHSCIWGEYKYKVLAQGINNLTYRTYYSGQISLFELSNLMSLKEITQMNIHFGASLSDKIKDEDCKHEIILFQDK